MSRKWLRYDLDVRATYQLPDSLPEQERAARAAVLKAAHEAHPERFLRKTPIPPVVPGAAWIITQSVK